MTFVAHGLGGSTDLPVPLSYALVGAAWALTFTFAIVALAWRKPRFDPAKPGLPLPYWVTRVVDSALTRWVVAILGLAFTAWVLLIAGLFGPQNNTNALPGVFYVLLWVGLVAVSLAAGPVWRLVSPMRTVYRITLGFFRFRRANYPASLGYYPAAFGLFAFVWLELASPDPGSLAAIKVWLLVYAVAMALGATVCGNRWFARTDPFEVYSVVVSRLSPFRRNHDAGRVVVGNPFDHLPSLPVRPGVVVVLAVLLGSTAFDSCSATPYFLSAHPSVLATVKVTCVVAGHIAAVIAAHDKALRLLPQGHQLTGQLAMMLTMVGYTFTGLYLLFGG